MAVNRVWPGRMLGVREWCETAGKGRFGLVVEGRADLEWQNMEIGFLHCRRQVAIIILCGSFYVRFI